MEDPFIDNWATQLRKGLLSLCVINAVSHRRMYGYDIVRALREVEGLVVSEGTIYPLLNRLKREGLLASVLEESSEGPARKYYALTERGRRLRERMNERWQGIVRGVDHVAGDEIF